MSLPSVVARVTELQLLAERALGSPLRPPPAVAGMAGGPTFATLLARAEAPGLVSTLGGPTASARLLAAAQGEVGQAESPPGSNDGPRLAVYRSTVAGAAAGQPWCAYFVSWAAARAGAPLGENGSGYGAVSQVEAWAARTGRLVPGGAAPRPGDLILFGGRHMGIVESVAADGSLTTIEGNSSDAVRRVRRGANEATAYVRID